MIKRVVLIIALIAIVVYGAKWYYGISKQDENTTEASRLKDTLQLATGALVVIGLFYTFLTFEYNHKKNVSEWKKSQDTLTFNTANAWNTAKMLTDQVMLDTFYKKFKHLECEPFYNLIHRKGNEEIRMAFAAIFNYLEMLSLAIENRLVEEKFTKLFMYEVFCSYYEDFNHHILYREKRRRLAELWINFRNVAERWKKEGPILKTTKTAYLHGENQKQC